MGHLLQFPEAVARERDRKENLSTTPSANTTSGTENLKYPPHDSFVENPKILRTYILVS